MSAFTPSGSGGSTSNIEITGATNPTILQISAAVAGTEYSAVLPIGTKHFLFKLRFLGKAQLSYTAGQSGTTFITVSRGCTYGESDLLLTSAVTVYFQTDTASELAEIVYWV